MTGLPQAPHYDKGRGKFATRLRNKNLAIAVGILALIVLFYFVTIVKLKGLPAHILAS